MSTLKRYRKKPVEVEAVQLTKKNTDEVRNWCGAKFAGGKEIGLNIATLEGTMRADIGDYIIQGVAGEFYPCKPDVFAATYEEVDE